TGHASTTRQSQAYPEFDLTRVDSDDSLQFRTRKSVKAYYNASITKRVSRFASITNRSMNYNKRMTSRHMVYIRLNANNALNLRRRTYV
ncbi:hypothetical protein LINPERHAP2_LOCUS3640, partial [Linum perenne]